MSESGIRFYLESESVPESDDFAGIGVGAAVGWVPGVGAGVGFLFRIRLPGNNNNKLYFNPSLTLTIRAIEQSTDSGSVFIRYST